MIWPFSRKAVKESPELRQAREATTRATDVVAEVADRRPEVEELVSNLRRRRLANNFGDALVAAMERRT